MTEQAPRRHLLTVAGGLADRERDERGRFMSDDDDDRRGYRSRSRHDDDDDDDRRGSRSRSRYDDDDDDRRGRPRGHSEASRRGWRRGRD
ncbi:MAG: hypothetical protein ISP45_16320 [Reyranella sp.]|nr:hypothetical protein [Reyranella sp.]